MEDNTEKLELLSLGDASIDSFITPVESDAVCNIDTKECFICFSYGDKIPVQSLDFSIGGNAANNSVGTSRLGINSAFISTLGDDNVGKQIIEGLKREKVDLTYVFTQPETNSNYSVIVNYQGERTIFTYHAPRSYEFPVKLPVTPWIYLTSMGENFKPFYTHIVEWLNKNPNVKMGFNPGSWQLRANPEEIKDIVNLTHIIFVNRQEAEKITGESDSMGKEKELLQKLRNLGPKIAVVTDGPNGSFASDGNKFYKAPILPVKVNQRTGAGDAFGSGCLSALIKGKNLDEALIWGTLNSASVVGFIGSQKGLLHDSEMPMWLDRYKSNNLKVSEI